MARMMYTKLATIMCILIPGFQTLVPMTRRITAVFVLANKDPSLYTPLNATLETACCLIWLPDLVLVAFCTV